MKKIILSLIISTSILFANFFQERDKKLHIGATFVIGTLVSMTAKKNGATDMEAFWWGLGSSLVIGLAKEAYDSRSGGTGFDGGDMLANSIGGSIGSSTGVVLMRF